MADDTKPFMWLLFLFLSSSSLCYGSELDIQCLKSIKRSVIDPNGIIKSYWNFEDDVQGSYVCYFTGVECWSPDEARILSLHLGNFGLAGLFPQGLHDCTSITALDLSNNNFSGPIPSDIAQQMPYLTSLDLSYNSFSGEMPESIANMAYLNVFNLQHNQLIGQIPERFNVFSRLTTFSVADNLLSGPLPALMHKFPAKSFAGNQGLCGSPLVECSAFERRTRGIQINKESSIGAAIGFVVGFVVALYSQHWFVLSKRLHAYFYHK